MSSLSKFALSAAMLIFISTSHATVTETYKIKDGEAPKIDVSINWGDKKGTSYPAEDNGTYDSNPENNTITITFDDKALDTNWTSKHITTYYSDGTKKDVIEEKNTKLSNIDLPPMSFPTFTSTSHLLITWVDLSQVPNSYGYAIGDHVSISNGVVPGLSGVKLLVGDSLIENLPADTPIIFSDSTIESLPLFSGIAIVNSEVVTSMVPEPDSVLLAIVGLTTMFRRVVARSFQRKSFL